MPIPQWFADAYTGGKRLGAGCGGPYSVATVGPAHFGPALAAFSTPNITANPARSSLSFTTLVGYPYTGEPYSTPDRARRDTNYSVDAAEAGWIAWPPKNGSGYWTDVDMIQGGVWIDLPDKNGMLFPLTQGNGRIYYATSAPNADSSSHAWFIYDPADLAKVSQGQKQEWEIQPQEYLVQYPGLGYPLAGFHGGPEQQITGVTYDSSTRRLYISVMNGQSDPGPSKVFVYEVQAGSNPTDTTPPAAPSRLRTR
jgi:hypothetical protein